jgi:hypothetical protein
MIAAKALYEKRIAKAIVRMMPVIKWRGVMDATPLLTLAFEAATKHQTNGKRKNQRPNALTKSSHPVTGGNGN